MTCSEACRSHHPSSTLGSQVQPLMHSTLARPMPCSGGVCRQPRVSALPAHSRSRGRRAEGMQAKNRGGCCNPTAPPAKGKQAQDWQSAQQARQRRAPPTRMLSPSCLVARQVANEDLALALLRCRRSRLLVVRLCKQRRPGTAGVGPEPGSWPLRGGDRGRRSGTRLAAGPPNVSAAARPMPSHAAHRPPFPAHPHLAAQPARPTR